MDNKLKTDSKVKVSFVISHFECLPEEVTKLLEVEPTRVKRKGEVNPPARVEQKFNLWILESNFKDEFDAEVQVKDLLSQMKHFMKVKDQFPGLEYGMDCVVYFVVDDTRPVLSFSKETIKMLAEFDCDLGIDYYLFSGEAEK